GYLGTGWNGPTKDWWMYDPASNIWSAKSDFGGVARGAASGFCIGGKGYLGIGGTGGPYLQDFWEYTPDSTTNVEELLNSDLQFSISPNPAKNFLILQYSLPGKGNWHLVLRDIHGKEVYSQQIITRKGQLIIDISQFSKGLHFIECNNGKDVISRKLLKE